ncbi:MAG: ABC transporter ATP-binding protein [Planctomycetota bacterium]
MADPVLLVRDLYKSYPIYMGLRKRRAVEDINFEAAPGDVVAILGPNGSGKSTFLRMLAGVEVPDRGTAQIHGFTAGSREACRSIGYCPEESPFPPYLSVKTCLHDLGVLSGLRGAALQSRMNDSLEKWNLTKEASSRTGRLSRGQARRLAIAQSLLHNPEILLLDEPTSGLDALGVITFEETMRAARAEGKCVLVSSHSASDVENMCGRILLMKNGKKVLDSPADEALTNPALTELLVENINGERENDVKKSIEAAGGRVVSIQKRRRSLAELFHSILK